MIHSQYNAEGSIAAEYWLNLYNALDSLKIDTVSDTDNHPGDLSQEYFAELYNTILQDKLNIK
jgi:hypothetical protein